MSLLEDFQAYLKENNSPISMRGYLSDIKIFLSWYQHTREQELTAARLKRDPHILNKAVFEEFITHLHTGKKAVATINRYTASVRVFGNFLVEQEIVPRNPAQKVKIEKLPLPAPRGLTDEERYKLEYIFTTPWERQTNKTARVRPLELTPKLLIRDRAIFITLLYTGLRVSELVALDLEDIEVKSRSGKFLVRRGKGNKPREIGLPKQVREVLSEWLKLRKEMGVKSSALFVDLKRDFTRLTSRTIQNILSEAGQRRNVHVTPHVLRHSYSYLLRRNGVQPEVRGAVDGTFDRDGNAVWVAQEDELNKAVESLDNEVSF